MLLLLRARPAPALASSIPISSFSSAPPPPSTPTPPRSSSSTLRCSVGNLSPVHFEPLRTDAHSDPDVVGVGVSAATTDTDEQYRQQPGDDVEDKGISGIHVPRQRYIAFPKAALLDALLSLFSSQPAAADFNRFARCLDAVLHAEHKETLEEMRTYYMLTLPNPGEDEQSDGQAVAAVNGNSSAFLGITQDDGTSFLSRSLDWRTLFSLSPDPVSPT